MDQTDQTVLNKLTKRRPKPQRVLFTRIMFTSSGSKVIEYDTVFGNLGRKLMVPLLVKSHGPGRSPPHLYGW
ncbi:hypothetical protein AOQ84DRAFT_418555 [Glonium stellatum]|uniref:Uncharacterized protein n=1 Tax=Glonium stellatum TaxID=574774 RepID=A0A8E2ERS8_9PEZI|nr:hypothetical protein AOQ84DRAFT_418555 [Glonium stellatum]